jgi:methylenetetrahydrofolate dehydrogenase (NADP+)/methenyltetrahydrofolate cyclohydrolase
MPAAFLLVRENATVTVCHSRTRDLARHTKDAEILVVAAGRAGLITGDIVRRGVVVVDVGINVVDGTLVGDVDFESVRPKAAAITPVPGGVGPLTNALLLAHLMRAASVQEDRATAAAAAEAPAVPARAPSRRPSVSAGTVPDQPPVTTLRGAR